jgi:hypothetical protein
MKNKHVGSFATAKLQAKRHSLLAIALAAVIGFAMTSCDDGSGKGGGIRPSSLYGTWENNTGDSRYSPLTLTVTAKTIKMQDNRRNYVELDVDKWVETPNTNDTYSADYPNGYLVSIKRTTEVGYNSSYFFSTSNGFRCYIALSTDGQSVYLGRDASRSALFAYAGPIYSK